MENPSDKTIETYRQNFDKYVERTPAEPSGEFKEWMNSFASHIPKDGVILEIGSASGREWRRGRRLKRRKLDETGRCPCSGGESRGWLSHPR